MQRTSASQYGHIVKNPPFGPPGGYMTPVVQGNPPPIQPLYQAGPFYPPPPQISLVPALYRTAMAPPPSPLPPIITQIAQGTMQLNTPSPSLNVNAPSFVPGQGMSNMRRPVRISTPNGDMVTFGGQVSPHPRVAPGPSPIFGKRPLVRMETAAQKEARLVKEREEMDRKSRGVVKDKNKVEREAKGRERAERRAKKKEEARLKAEAEAKAVEETEGKAKTAAATAAAAKVKGAEVEAGEGAKEEGDARATLSDFAFPKSGSGQTTSATTGWVSSLFRVHRHLKPPIATAVLTTLERPKRPDPGSLGVSPAQENRSVAPVLAPPDAQAIEDWSAVQYPDSIKTSNPDLNATVTRGRCRYDRDFLLQFMNVCKKRPDSLAPLAALAAIGLVPDGQGASGPFTGGNRHVDLMGMHQVMIALRAGADLPHCGRFTVANSQPPTTQSGGYQSQSEATVGVHGSRAPLSGPTDDRLSMARSEGQGGVGGGGPGEVKMTRGQRRIEREVKALLNNLKMDEFESISDQIIQCTNRAEQEKDGSTLARITKLVYEKAKDEELSSEVYARLCHKMVECVSPRIRDQTSRSSTGQPIKGGALFRRYLLNQCQEDFERKWITKESAPAAVASNKVTAAVGQESGKVMPHSYECYVMDETKRRDLGLIQFLGELFKLQMLNERIMHQCIKKLLANVVGPEEGIESLCKLLTTVGRILDTPRARTYMNIYFEQIQDMAKRNRVNPSVGSMLLDLIELRARHWQAHSTSSQPATCSIQDKRDGFGRGEHHSATELDGWNVTSRTDTHPPAHISALLRSPPSSVTHSHTLNNMFAAFGGGPAENPSILTGRTASNHEAGTGLGLGGLLVAGMYATMDNFLMPSKSTKIKGKKKASRDMAALAEIYAEAEVKEGAKKYLDTENVNEAIMALKALPTKHRHLFVGKLVNAALDSGDRAVALTEKLFEAVHKGSIISPEGFERGLLPTVGMAEDLRVDVPKVYEWLARFLVATGLDKT